MKLVFAHSYSDDTLASFLAPETSTSRLVPETMTHFAGEWHRQKQNKHGLWSLTVAQTESLESLQKRAMRIIFPHLDYSGSLFIAEADTLEGRRERLAQRFFPT